MFTHLADTALRLRRLVLSRQIRHLEAMVKSHTKTLSAKPGGKEQIDETLRVMQQLRQKLGETSG